MLRPFIFAIALSVALLPGSAFADKPKPIDERTKIGSVDAKAGTIEFVHTHVDGSTITKYVLAADATIEMAGKTVKLAAVKSGLHVKLFTLSSTMSDPPIIEDLELEN